MASSANVASSTWVKSSINIDKRRIGIVSTGYVWKNVQSMDVLFNRMATFIVKGLDETQHEGVVGGGVGGVIQIQAEI